MFVPEKLAITPILETVSQSVALVLNVYAVSCTYPAEPPGLIAEAALETAAVAL